MQYNDTRIQYDQSNVLYDGSWTLTISETASFSESIANNIQIAIAEISTKTEVLAISMGMKFMINEVATFSETMSKKIGIIILETITMSEAFTSMIRAIISEVSAKSESFTSRIRIALRETSTRTEAITKSIATAFSEISLKSESVARKIGTTLSDVSTITETFAFTFHMVINEVSTLTETMIRNVFERLRGVIGMIKEFVRIGDKKEKVSAINVGEGMREELNDPYRQYDDSSVLYDQENICYNNFISSEKPVSVLGKKYNNVSVSSKKDKPAISKK